MSRTTLSDIRNSRIPVALNVGPKDPRLVAYVNEAVRRLMTRGLYWGSYGTFDISVTSQLMTLPPHLETIESIMVASMPIPIRDSLYQFVDSGWGQRDETQVNGTGIGECMLLGNYPTAVDIVTPGVVSVSCEVPTDSLKPVIVSGYDNNNNWVRQQVAGEYHNGEQLLLVQSPGLANSTTKFSRITDVQVPQAMDGQWWLYQGLTLLSNYQYWETNPSYKRFLVPFLPNIPTTARVVGRRAFIPVRNDTDYTILGNMSAIKLASMAIKAEEEFNLGLANILWNGGASKNGQKIMGAIQELDDELTYQLGVGRELTIDIKPTSFSEPVETLR